MSDPIRVTTIGDLLKVISTLSAGFSGPVSASPEIEGLGIDWWLNNVGTEVDAVGLTGESNNFGFQIAPNYTCDSTPAVNAARKEQADYFYPLIKQVFNELGGVGNTNQVAMTNLESILEQLAAISSTES